MYSVLKSGCANLMFTFICAETLSQPAYTRVGPAQLDVDENPVEEGGDFGTVQDAQQVPFSSLIADHQQHVEEDNTDNGPAIPASEWVPLTLAELFDFDTPIWKTWFDDFIVYTYDEELALYDLIEADAEGEDEDDLGIDPATETVLLD
ncbi:hypothetical protein BJ165DRAFT_1455436 [Panaeolus papilionaceus]|nr:hypothetical protein BJ165DRAFT_1455436 [Panaeolus papilionaceus]